MSDLYCIKPPSGLYKNNKKITDWVIQPKLDGFRCLFISDGETFNPTSPNGNPLYNLNHIIEELVKIPGALDYNIDGELYGLSFNETSKIVRASVTKKESKHISLYCFDLVNRKEYESKVFKEPYSQRYENYIKLFKDCEFIKTVKSTKCVSDSMAWKTAEKFVRQGYEGAVIKNSKGVYKCGRSQDIQRLKFSDTLDLVIEALEEGEGDNEGRLGNVVCDYLGVKIRVGIGFSRELRKEMWDNPKKFIGVCIEVKYQEKTIAGSLRFPAFVRFRYDK